MLLDLRRDAWDKAKQTSEKPASGHRARYLAKHRNHRRDLTLQAVVDNLKAPGVAEASPELRQLILFDRAASARDLGVMLVLDENGDVIVDSSAWRRASSTTPTATTSRRTRPVEIWGSS